MNLAPRYARVLLAAGVALLLLSFGSIILVVTRDAPRRMRTIDITPPTPGELSNVAPGTGGRQSEPSVTPSPQRATKTETYAAYVTIPQEVAELAPTPTSAIDLNDAIATVNSPLEYTASDKVEISYDSYYSNNQAWAEQLTCPDVAVCTKLPALIAHNPTDEPDNVYPLPSEGFYRHIREDLGNKLETRATNTTYTITVPLIDIVRDAFDQTVLPKIKHYKGDRSINLTNVGETHAFVLNTIKSYPDLDYPVPTGASRQDWLYGLEDWNGLDWIRIPNPRHTFVHIPVEYRDFIIQEPGNSDLLVPAMTLTFDLGTLLPYEWRESAIRYRIHSRELFGRGISFSVEPVTGTLVLEGDGGSVYTAVGQHPVPSEITYTDLWGRVHAVTETVRSAFYNIIPYDKTGDAVSTQMASTYSMTGESGELLFDFPPYQVVTLTVMLKAQSVNRDLSAEQLIIQKIPRGLGYDIEFVTWEASNGSFQLLDGNTINIPASDLLYFQGALPENEPSIITLTANRETI